MLPSGPPGQLVLVGVGEPGAAGRWARTRRSRSPWSAPGPAPPTPTRRHGSFSTTVQCTLNCCPASFRHWVSFEPLRSCAAGRPSRRWWIVTQSLQPAGVHDHLVDRPAARRRSRSRARPSSRGQLLGALPLAPGRARPRARRGAGGCRTAPAPPRGVARQQVVLEALHQRAHELQRLIGHRADHGAGGRGEREAQSQRHPARRPSRRRSARPSRRRSARPARRCPASARPPAPPGACGPGTRSRRARRSAGCGCARHAGSGSRRRRSTSRTSIRKDAERAPIRIEARSAVAAGAALEQDLLDLEPGGDVGRRGAGRRVRSRPGRPRARRPASAAASAKFSAAGRSRPAKSARSGESGPAASIECTR